MRDTEPMRISNTIQVITILSYKRIILYNYNTSHQLIIKHGYV